MGSFSTKLGCPRHVRFTPIATELRTSLEVRIVPKGDTARTQGANRICRQAAGNCERVIGGAGFAVDGLG
jgi:hypothetical protein